MTHSVPVADTVTIRKIDQTDQWSWIRYLPVAGIDDEVHGVVSNVSFATSAAALTNAKAVNADISGGAFVVDQ